jgi:DNA-directed RNA polymerase I and III subunit RPAC1
MSSSNTSSSNNNNNKPNYPPTSATTSTTSSTQQNNTTTYQQALKNAKPTSYSLSTSLRAPIPQFDTLNLGSSLNTAPQVTILSDTDCNVARYAEIVFELKGVSVAFANAMRRIMLGEIPTMAIEVVKVFRNDSVMQDEVLAHRLGLLPVIVDNVEAIDSWTRHGELTPTNCVPFLLNFVAGNETQSDQTVHLMAKELIPISWEAAMRLEANEGDIGRMGNTGEPSFGAKLLYDDIVLTKMKPREGIKLLAFATKGIGLEHAKWSPVSTASYKMKPAIKILTPFRGADAIQIRDRCPARVFDIEESSDLLTVARLGDCTMCRECIREGPAASTKEGEPAKISLSRQADTFIFTVEASGQLRVRQILKRTFEVLKEKALQILADLSEDDDEIVEMKNS